MAGSRKQDSGRTRIGTQTVDANAGGDGTGETAARKDNNHQRVGGGGTKPDGGYGTSGRGGGHA